VLSVGKKITEELEEDSDEDWDDTQDY